MLQRIQTLFLLMVTSVSAALFLVPFVEYTSAKPSVVLSLLPSGAVVGLSGIYYLPVAINIINMVFSAFIIMQYKRRVFQMKLANLLMVLSLILLGVLLLFDYVKPEFAGNPPIKKYLYGAYLPIISVICSFLAARAIKRDEELVRSADRLR